MPRHPGELQQQNRRDRADAHDVVAQDHVREPRLLGGVIRLPSEPYRIGDRAARRETNGAEGEEQGQRRPPAGKVATSELGAECTEGDHHGRRDEPVHRPGRGRDARVVRGDGASHFGGNVVVGIAPRLHVEHQVEPQHAEEKACSRNRGERPHAGSG